VAAKLEVRNVGKNGPFVRKARLKAKNRHKVFGTNRGENNGSPEQKPGKRRGGKEDPGTGGVNLKTGVGAKESP